MILANSGRGLSRTSERLKAMEEFLEKRGRSINLARDGGRMGLFRTHGMMMNSFIAIPHPPKEMKELSREMWKSIYIHRPKIYRTRGQIIVKAWAREQRYSFIFDRRIPKNLDAGFWESVILDVLVWLLAVLNVEAGTKGRNRKVMLPHFFGPLARRLRRMATYEYTPLRRLLKARNLTCCGKHN